MMRTYFTKLLLAFSVGLLFATFIVSADSTVEDLGELVAIDETPIDRSLNGGVVSYAVSVAEVRKAVVSVASKRVFDGDSNSNEDLLRRFFGGGSEPREARGLGSGVIVTKNGYILTNNHVVEEADEVTVTLQDGKVFDAKVVGTDPQTDIAVLKIDADSLPQAQLANSDNIEVGDVVFAIGNPLGVGQTVTMGIVSAKGRNQLNMIENGYENFIQTDASINQGNSGGALVDAYGRVLGINTMILTDGRSSGNIGIGFAIPTNMAHHVMTSLVEKGSVTRGFLGVSIQDLDRDLAESFGLEDAKGVIVREVTADTPADRAGIRQGDVILRVDEQEIALTNDLRLKIANRKPGSPVVITVFRDDRELSLTTVLAEFDREAIVADFSPSSELFSGVMVEPLTPELRDNYGIDEKVTGLIVTSLSPDSPYARDFQEGLVIEKIKNRAVTSVEDARALLISGKKAALFVYIEGFYRYIAVDAE